MEKIADSLKTFRSSLLFLFLFPWLLFAQDLPNVAIVITGGSIVQVNDPKTGASIPAQNAEEILNAVPELKKLANISFVPFSNLDSSQMTPELWAQLSQRVNQLLTKPEIHGVVVVHGTDTMAEGAYFLDLTIRENKPVVFVGAMKNSSDPYSDGPSNLIDAVSQVCSPEAHDWGVTVTLNNYIHPARFVEKKQSTNVQSFSSGDKGILGYIVNKKVYRINDHAKRPIFSVPSQLPKVDIVFDYAGSDGSFIRTATDNGANGIIVEGFGSGNVNSSTYNAILYAINKGVAVVITTRVAEGGVFPFYGDKGGGFSLKEAGAIVAGDLPAAKARILLMLTLPIVKSNHSKLYDYFLND